MTVDVDILVASAIALLFLGALAGVVLSCLDEDEPEWELRIVGASIEVRKKNSTEAPVARVPFDPSDVERRADALTRAEDILEGIQDLARQASAQALRSGRH